MHDGPGHRETVKALPADIWELDAADSGLCLSELQGMGRVARNFGNEASPGAAATQ